MVFAALIWMATAGAASCTVVDVGQADDGSGPLAVVVETPGFAPSVFDPYVAALEGQGIDVVALRLPLPCHDPEALLAQALPRALSARPGRPTVVVAHGWAGSLAVETVATLPAGERPAALALVGTPLQWEPRAVWQVLLAGLEPGRDWRLAHRPKAPAHEEAFGLFFGEAELALTTLGAPYVQRLQEWMAQGHRVSTRELGLPVYAVAASLDRLAPVEAIRPLLAPHQTFVRYGRASLLRHEADHTYLLTNRQPPTELARWAAKTLGTPP